jgi:hypothetical protein
MNEKSNLSARQLFQIFAPQAARHIDEFVQKHPGGDHVRLVHYTSAEPALKIIQNKKLWMRNVTCMSDVSEMDHGRGMLTRLFDDATLRDDFFDATDACDPGVAKYALELFNRRAKDIRSEAYLACVSEHDKLEDDHGRLSMWRTFGGSAARVALVFRVPVSTIYLEVFNLVFSPVEYFSYERVQSTLRQVTSNVRSHCDELKKLGRDDLLNHILNMLLAAVTCLKNPIFQEEREWRLIYFPSTWPSKLIETTTETPGGIPQVVHQIPFDSKVAGVPPALDFTHLFDRLIIGPCQYPWAMREAYIAELKKIGVTDPNVVVSDIPIRF